MSDALEITVVGMSLVFSGILVLWGLMVLLVWLLPATENEPESEAAPDEHELKLKAAAAAVAIALAKEADAVREYPLQELPLVSAWQATRRASQFRQRKQWK